MTRVLSLVGVLLAVCAAACAGGGDARVAAQDSARPDSARPDSGGVDSLAIWIAQEAAVDPSHALFGCLHGDSAVYADLRPDPETGDTSGVLIALWQAGDGVDGAIATAVDPTHALPISGARLFARDSITLEMPHPDDPAETSRFVGRVSCEKLWGRQRNYRDAPTRPVVYARVRPDY